MVQPSSVRFFTRRGFDGQAPRFTRAAAAALGLTILPVAALAQSAPVPVTPVVVQQGPAVPAPPTANRAADGAS